NRYRENLPADNYLPHVITTRLYRGEPANESLGDWRSSDRPPLQSGWQLLTQPAAKVLALDQANTSATSAVWFQLRWVAAGDRLLKWHLGGQEAKNETVGAWQVIRETYATTPWREMWATKAHNLRTQLDGDFRGMFSVSPAGSKQRREYEFFNAVRGLTWWPLFALVAL